MPPLLLFTAVDGVSEGNADAKLASNEEEELFTFESELEPNAEFYGLLSNRVADDVMMDGEAIIELPAINAL